MAKCWGMLKPLPTSYTKVSTESFYWVFGSFFADVLSRQTEKFWNRHSILLPTYLAPEFWGLSICSGVVVITTAHLHSTKPEIRFCAGSNPTCSVSEIRDGEDLWQWSRLEIRLNAFRWSTVPQKQFIIIVIIIISYVNILLENYIAFYLEILDNYVPIVLYRIYCVTDGFL